MDAAGRVGAAAALVAVLAAVFAGSQARSARRQAVAAEQHVAESRHERQHAAAIQGRLAVIDFDHVVMGYLRVLRADAEAGGPEIRLSVSANSRRGSRSCAR